MTTPDTILDSAGSDAGLRWSAAILDADSGVPLWSRNAGDVLKTASVGKIFLLIEVARQAAAGELDMDEMITRTADQMVADSGLWHVLDVESLSIRDCCALIGAVSDNLATNMLVQRIGIDAVTRTSEGLGFTDSALLDRIREERLPEHPPTLSRGSGRELAMLMSRLHRADIVSPEVSQRVLEWLSLNTDLSMVGGAFGFDPLAHPDPDRGYLLRNKTGTISTARIDVGVVTASGRSLAWAVLANWASDEPSARDHVLAAMNQLGWWMRAQLDA